MQQPSTHRQAYGGNVGRRMVVALSNYSRLGVKSKLKQPPRESRVLDPAASAAGGDAELVRAENSSKISVCGLQQNISP